MRVLPKFAFAVVLLAIIPVALAQDRGTSTVAVEQPWARATPSGARTGAVYMTLDNKAATADRLTGASAEVAEKTQIHEMTVANGVMRMRELANGLAIPAGGSVTLKPGGYHVMLIGLKKPLTADETFSLTLTFEKAGNISITVPVQAMGAIQDHNGDRMDGMKGNKSGGMGNMEMK